MVTLNKWKMKARAFWMAALHEIGLAPCLPFRDRERYSYKGITMDTPRKWIAALWHFTGKDVCENVKVALQFYLLYVCFSVADLPIKNDAVTSRT